MILSTHDWLVILGWTGISFGVAVGIVALFIWGMLLGMKSED